MPQDVDPSSNATANTIGSVADGGRVPDPVPNLSVIILTFNSEATIGATLQAANALSDDVYVVDSYSADSTPDLVRAQGATFVQHPFENYGIQRNWAIDSLPLEREWQLHLDADERLTDRLADAIRALFAEGPPAAIDGYHIPRMMHFHGQPIRHGGMYPIWHMRLFRTGKGRCEERRYDQHFFVPGETDRIPEPFIDDIRMGIGEFMDRHNRWADAEVDELLGADGTRDDNIIAGKLTGDPIEKKRALRGFFNRMPLVWRAFGLFFYRYVLRFGFLDGRQGLVFFALQTLAFRLIIDAKLIERRNDGTDMS